MKIMFLRNRNVLNTKWLVQFVNLLHEKGNECVVVCNTYKKIGNGNKFSDEVKLININAPQANTLFSKLQCIIKDKLLPPYWGYSKVIQQEKPDILICYFPVDLFNVTRFQKHNIPIIMMMHNFPPSLMKKYQKNNGEISYLYKNSFEQVSAFQVLMESYKDAVKAMFPQKEVSCIPNLVNQISPIEQADLEIEKKRIIYVARIEKEGKRPHLLVESFAKVASDFPDWIVEIWGLSKYPDYEQQIINFAKKKNISHQIFIKGFSENISEVYQSADLQGFPSKMEGFGLGLADGMAFGLPSIGFTEADGVNELIVDGENGFLAKTTDDFAEKLKLLMQDKKLRIKMGKSAVEDMKKYAPDIVIEKWQTLINHTSSKR